ncbi:MAG: carboxynorspermidine decarboxylase [Opitutales bacterium]
MNTVPDYARMPLDRLERTPAYVINVGALEAQAAQLAAIGQRCGAQILLALKAFAAHATFPRLRPYLAGVTASGIHEAWLGREFELGGVHVYSPAFKPGEMAHLVRFAHTLVFNSPGQWQRFRPVVEGAGRQIERGLRVNPGHGEVAVALYNPCAPGSRLGTPVEDIRPKDLDGLDGLHFHTLCEQGADVLERTLAVFEAQAGHLLPSMSWVNLGGGHHITAPGYDVDKLVGLVRGLAERYGVRVYLEPGEAFSIQTGVLVAEVLDCFDSRGTRVAVLDVSATAHMPDVLEMPYRPAIVGGHMPGERAHTYRLGGPTCLAGDIIGDYSFDAPLEVGQRLTFLDMSHYTMVKTTTFNGVPHPDICTYDARTDRLELVRRFGYGDFRNRLS